MHVIQLWRFPVKSMGGERIDQAHIDDLGIEGDRRWGIRDVKTGKVLTAKREGKLLTAKASYQEPDTVGIVLPDGTETTDDDVLSEWLGRKVRLEAAGPEGGLFENPRDFENEADWVSWQGPPGAWHDMRRARVSLVSQDSLGHWDVRRFRTNIVVDCAGEDDLVGTQVRIGSVVLDVTKQIDRCVMVTRAQPGVPRDLEVLKAINRERATFLAVGALVAQQGVIQIGDRVVPLPQKVWE